ncbi:MAG: glycosyltransferase family 4 protein [Pyrinomonadaceae bacterium]
MKILIDGQTLLTPDINRGIGTYFRNCVEHLLANDFTNDFYLNTTRGEHLGHLSPWARAQLRVIERAAYDTRAPESHPGNYLAEIYSDMLHDDIEKEGIDLYWSPNALMGNVLLAERRDGACRFAVTVFDLIFSVMRETYAKHLPPASFEAYDRKLEILERDYDLFLHISHHTRADFARTRAGERGQHVVTPLAAGDLFRPYPFPQVPVENDYVLYPGGLDPRKNMARAVEAFAVLQSRHGDDERVRATRLCIVCHLEGAAADELLGHAEGLGLGGKVTLTDFVEDDDLLALYQKARCLFFPSLYEGFGLPILEGLACGLPVAASNTSSLPEVGGEFATYFDPKDTSDMADALYRALQEPTDYESRLRRYEYARQFSWRKTALSTLAAFDGCVRGVGRC